MQCRPPACSPPYYQRRPAQGDYGTAAYRPVTIGLPGKPRSDASRDRLLGEDRVELAGELADALTQGSIRAGRHERLARVQRADRAAVLVDDLVVDLAPE